MSLFVVGNTECITERGRLHVKWCSRADLSAARSAMVTRGGLPRVSACHTSKVHYVDLSSPQSGSTWRRARPVPAAATHRDAHKHR